MAGYSGALFEALLDRCASDYLEGVNCVREALVGVAGGVCGRHAQESSIEVSRDEGSPEHVVVWGLHDVDRRDRATGLFLDGLRPPGRLRQTWLVPAPALERSRACPDHRARPRSQSRTQRTVDS